MIEDPSRIKNISINPKAKTPVTRIGCENCFTQDTVICYAEDIHDRDFHQKYFECEDCKSVLCAGCVEKELRCEFCGNDSFFQLKPLHLYVCGSCIEEGKKVCHVCRYPELDQSILFSD